MEATWVIAVTIVIGILSFAFVGDNKLYNFMERTAVGITVGHTTVIGIGVLRTSAFPKIAKGQYILLVPILFGLLYLSRFKKEWAFMAAYPTCLILGVGIGLGLSTMIKTEFLKQITATASLSLLSVGNLLVILAVVTVLSMFMFTERLSRWFAPPALRVAGRQFVMLTLGVLWATMTFDRLVSLSGVVVAEVLRPFIK